jgi:hypothetical protein
MTPAIDGATEYVNGEEYWKASMIDSAKRSAYNEAYFSWGRCRNGRAEARGAEDEGLDTGEGWH